MKRLNERLGISRKMLEKLEEGLIRWTPLMKAVVKESSSPWKAQVIIKWLLTRGYISRPERGVHQITEKGRELLRAI